MKQINRTGAVSFGDASLAVWEEGERATNGRCGLADGWEQQFKREVFKRIVQALNRLGWTCAVPADKVKQYSRSFAENFRDCSKGALRGELQIGGRRIAFDMWQGVNTPTRPDHGGKYESDKEGCMPYLLRIEMERTRRRIRDYICNVFSGYTFDEKRRSIYRRPMEQTALERIQEHYAESWHFKGEDFAAYAARDGCGMAYNRKSADGALLEHGQRVWGFDHHGRCFEGTALYNINNMWWVVTGRYSYTNVACFDLYAAYPPNPRIKRNSERRRARLESLMAAAVKAMKFERAAQLRDILNPNGEPLYLIKCKGDGLYFAPNYRGYRKDPVDAGKYTRAELRPYLRDGLETDQHVAVAVA